MPGLVVVDDFDLPGISVPPFKTNSPLVIDPNTPLAFAIAAELFEPVPRRLREFFNPIHAFDLSEFPEGGSFDRGEFPAVKAPEQPLGIFIPERADHALA
jgi:hypothetical protein